MERIKNRLLFGNIVAILILAWSISSSRGQVTPSAAALSSADDGYTVAALTTDESTNTAASSSVDDGYSANIVERGVQPQDEPLAIPDTAFTYQGQLKRNGSLVTGTCSFRFSLWNALTAGAQQGSTQQINSIAVKDGAFTVVLNFGNQFPGAARWLQTSVKCGSETSFTMLTPRQALTATPYALSLRPGARMIGPVNCCGQAMLRADNTSDGVGLWGSSTGGTGIYGESALEHTYSAAGVYGKSTGDGGIGVIGEAPTGNSLGVYGITNGGTGVYGQATTGVAVTGANIYGGIAMKAQGNAVQNPSYGGWVKAMVRMQGDGFFVDCYNGVTGGTGTLANCGFSIASVGGGQYDITFNSGINVQYQFFSLSGSSSIYLIGYPGDTTVRISVGVVDRGYAYYILVF